MKMLKKRKNNKGFSLVELIVVVAIMGVIIGILVPTLIGNVEKSRLATDKKNLDELRNAITIALTDEKYMDATGTITFTDATTITTTAITAANTGLAAADATAFVAEVDSNLGTSSFDLSSRLKGDATIAIEIASGVVTVEVTGGEGGNYVFTLGN